MIRRRCNDALYFTGELLEKIERRTPIRLWDVVNILYPYDTNRKQFYCTLKLLQNLNTRDKMSNIEILRVYESKAERYLLVGKILPKLKKFRVVEVDGMNGSKKYNIKFNTGFGDLIRNMGQELIRSDFTK